MVLANGAHHVLKGFAMHAGASLELGSRKFLSYSIVHHQDSLRLDCPDDFSCWGLAAEASACPCTLLARWFPFAMALRYPFGLLCRRAGKTGVSAPPFVPSTVAAPVIAPSVGR